jgi:hypothetical protein
MTESSIGQDAERRLQAIENRNKRVEADKAWERSFTRVSVIALITYIAAMIFLLSVRLPYPFLNALVPAMGYILSMQSLPIVKRRWLATALDPERSRRVKRWWIKKL